MDDLIYRSDVVNGIHTMLDELNKDHILDWVFSNYEVRCAFMEKLFDVIYDTQSTFWHPCDDEHNVPPKGEEVLVSLEYPNGKKEIAFGEHWGENRNGDLAFWGGQNELVKAWAKIPDPYEE